MHVASSWSAMQIYLQVDKKDIVLENFWHPFFKSQNRIKKVNMAVPYPWLRADIMALKRWYTHILHTQKTKHINVNINISIQC